MPFRHFHKHSGKYLLFAFLAMVFSLFTFNITDALTTFASRSFGGTGGAYFVFRLSSGREVGIEEAEWMAAQAEVPGAHSIFASMSQFDPYSGIESPRDRALAHSILLAEAGEMNIEMPPERADAVVERYQRFLQQIVQMQQPGRQLTVADWKFRLRQLRLTEERLKLRLVEMFKVEAYVRAMNGVRVHDPVRMEQLFAERAVEVGLEYVEFPFDRYAEQMRADPPADEVLAAWFEALPPEVIAEKYTRGRRFAVDLAVVDGDAWDPASLPADLLPPAVEPTDEEVLRDVKGDVRRYVGDGAAPATIEEVSAESRAKVARDRRLRTVFEKLRAEFDLAVAALPAVSGPPPKLPDGSPDVEAEAKRKAEHDERVARERQLFAEIAAKYGLEIRTFVDQEAKQLAELDPPRDPALQFMAPGLRTPGGSGPEQRTQSSLPARERRWGYVVRLADDPRPSEPLPFDEARPAALEQWIEENAKKRALESARRLADAMVAEAEKTLPEAVAALLREELEAYVRRSEAIARERSNAELTDEQKKSIRESAEREHLFNVQAAAHARTGARFAEVARSLGLEVKTAGPHRKSVSSEWYYNDRFTGAERFLFRQAENGSSPALLGCAEGTVSEVLVSDADRTAWVARVASRRTPSPSEMTPKDRKEVEDEERAQWAQEERGSPRPAYADPFSIARLLKRHEPRFRETTTPAGGAFGYY